MEALKRNWNRPVPIIIFFSLFVYLLLPKLPDAKIGDVRLWFDYWDLGVYYGESRWVVTNEVLFRDVKTEYPLLANLIFGGVRLVAGLLTPLTDFRAPDLAIVFPDLLPFLWIWISTAFALFFFLTRASRRLDSRNLWFWLAPAPIYFALYRFDVFPVAATFLFLWLLYKERYLVAMVALGLAIALKGYAMIYLPALFVFFWFRVGFFRSGLYCFAALVPFLIGNLLVWAVLDLDAMLMPYLNQFGRGLNGESTYNTFIGLAAFVSGEWGRRVADFFTSARPTMILHVTAALVSMLLRPRTMEQLARVGYFSTMAFISASTFYSPQFLLWVLPFACFFFSRSVFYGTVIFSIATFAYFPIAMDLGSSGPARDVLTFLRLFLIFAPLVGFFDRPARDHGSDPTPGPVANV